MKRLLLIAVVIHFSAVSVLAHNRHQHWMRHFSLGWGDGYHTSTVYPTPPHANSPSNCSACQQSHREHGIAPWYGEPTPTPPHSVQHEPEPSGMEITPPTPSPATTPEALPAPESPSRPAGENPYLPPVDAHRPNWFPRR